MPAKAVKKGDKFRVVEPTGKLVRNAAGTPIDGGGHKTKAKAAKQAAAVNIPKIKRKGS